MTLTETLLAMVIGAFMIVGGVILFTNAEEDSKTSQANQQLYAIISGVEGLYAAKASYADLDTDIALANAIFPAAMTDGTNVRNPWKGDVEVTGSAGSYVITYEGVPASACAEMVAASNEGQGGGIVNITVNGTNADADGEPPISVADATDACSIQTAAGNDIAWTIR